MLVFFLSEGQISKFIVPTKDKMIDLPILICKWPMGHMKMIIKTPTSQTIVYWNER